MSDRLRVLYLSSWRVGPNGAEAVSFIYEQIEALSKVVTAAYVEPRFESISSWLRRRLAGGTSERISELWPRDVLSRQIHLPRFPTRLTRRSYLMDVGKSAAQLAKSVRRDYGQVDLVHAHVVLPAGLFGLGLAEELEVPLVLQEHSAPFEMHLDTPEKRACVRRVLSQANRVAAVGSDLANRLCKAGADRTKIAILPNRVATDLFRPQPQKYPLYPVRLISVGSLTERKGFVNMLHAVALLVATGKKVSLTIVGSGPLREKLEHLCARLSLTEHVTFLGHLDRRATAEAIAQAHIYVCASHRETFGLAPAEALSVGRPVVTTRCGGPEEFIGEEDGAVVDVGDTSALANAVLRIVDRLYEYDPYELHQRIDQRFGPQRFTNRVLSLYKEVVGRTA